MTGSHGEQWGFKTMKRLWNILITGSRLDDMENLGSRIFTNNEKAMEHSDHWIMSGSHRENSEILN
jgi:hypothetical protein